MSETRDATPDPSPVCDLLIEDAGERGRLVHVPDLPGLSFRLSATDRLEEIAPVRIREYVRWPRAEELTDLTPRAKELVQRHLGPERADVRTRVSERADGAPVWESGNPAVLFACDRRPLDDATVVAHIRFARRVLDCVRNLVLSDSSLDRSRRPAPGRRSVDETLTHIGNCVWWYCSRIDDALPEPEEPTGEDPLDRIDRLFESAKPFLLAVPFAERARIHVPGRFPTKDPNERWTHGKVCRRQAEHVWAHLRGLESGIGLRDDALP